MDIKDTFKKLLKSHYMPDLNYMEVKFSFSTVFGKSYDTYRCCTCAYEHEYLDYISETGEVNEEMFEKVVENIMKGECPHVAGVPEEFVTETCIFPIHIAAALGTERAIEDYKRYCDSHSGQDRDSIHGSVFHLHPFEIALLKNNIQTASFIRYGFSGTCCFTCTSVLCAKRALDQVNRIQFERMSVPEFYVRTTNSLLLQHEPCSLHLGTRLAKALFFAYIHGSVDLKDDLLDYMKHISSDPNPIVIKLYTIFAIFYDQSEVLSTLLANFRQCGISEDTKCFIAEACAVLQRQNCQTVLSRFNFTGHKFKLNREYPRLKKMVSYYLLDEFSAQFSDEVKNSVKHNLKDAETKDIGARKSEHLSLLHQYIRTSREFHEETMKVLLEVASDIDNVHHDFGTPLTHLLRNALEHSSNSSIRSAIELLIYANPSVNHNNCAVDIAFKVDEKYKNFEFDLFGSYLLMDAKEHSVLVHTEDGYALNFLGPLLIECGFPVSRQTLQNVLDKNLHLTEIAYIRQCLEQPRALRVCCRDTLRKHFKGHAIHDFVKIAILPEKTSNFILLKSVLKSI